LQNLYDCPAQPCCDCAKCDLGEAGVDWSDVDAGMRCVVLSEDVQRLRAFALVVDLGSISVAATVLGQTQRAVWQQLEAFEREVGAALVDRSRRPLRATEAGNMLRPQVDLVLAALRGSETRRAQLASR
jgi:hypothetical protein